MSGRSAQTRPVAERATMVLEALTWDDESVERRRLQRQARLGGLQGNRTVPVGGASSSGLGGTTSADGSTGVSNGGGDLDDEVDELSRIRCSSECTEVVAEREKRRQRRCADYPGFAFGSSIFSSDTMMKFNIIKNELHNIMKTQLKRVSKDSARGLFVSARTRCTMQLNCASKRIFRGSCVGIFPLYRQE